jgi:NAD(P)-dependent dehydrogenase (short-subunit alcohol dehydrogenase family)
VDMSSEAPSAIYPSLRNKTVLISGAAEGIGAAAVELFSRQGSKVIFFDIATNSAKALVDKIKTIDGATEPVFYECDVTDLEQLKTATDTALARYGPVHVLVNNAASAGASARLPTAEITPEAWEFTINVNLRHLFFLTQHVVPSMRSAGGGSIINMGSISWRIPATGLPVYTLSKAAILGMTRTHAREFGPDKIRVNSVMPGAIATERQIKEVLTEEYLAETMGAQALKRTLMPPEVASVILFLASADSSAVTGSSYVVDGGWCGDP